MTTDNNSPKKSDNKPTKISGEIKEASFERAPNTKKSEKK